MFRWLKRWRIKWQMSRWTVTVGIGPSMESRTRARVRDAVRSGRELLKTF